MFVRALQRNSGTILSAALEHSEQTNAMGVRFANAEKGVSSMAYSTLSLFRARFGLDFELFKQTRFFSDHGARSAKS